VPLLSVAGAAAHAAVRLTADAAPGGLTINLFWIIVSALNFIVFFALFQAFGSGPLTKMLNDRRERIAQGLADAEQARKDREASVAERQATLVEARREAKEIIDRAQKVAQETRDADIAATRDELERLRVRAAADIEAEKERAMLDLRGEVANLALSAAGQVVGETMSDPRQRRLVEEFLAKTGSAGSSGSSGSAG
jgi:F-type H+-transporting ATPase subunit b